MTDERVIPSSPDAAYLLTIACAVLLADQFPGRGTPDQRNALIGQTVDAVFDLLTEVSRRLSP